MWYVSLFGLSCRTPFTEPRRWVPLQESVRPRIKPRRDEVTEGSLWMLTAWPYADFRFSYSSFFRDFLQCLVRKLVYEVFEKLQDSIYTALTVNLGMLTDWPLADSWCSFSFRVSLEKLLYEDFEMLQDSIHRALAVNLSPSSSESQTWRGLQKCLGKFWLTGHV